MKRLFTILAVLAVALVAPALMLAQASNAEQQVLDIQKQHLKALVKADVATLEKILPDDTIIIGSTGQVTGKADVINGIRSGKVRFDAEDITDSKVRVFGNVALLNATEHIVGQYLGNDISGQYRVTYVFVKRDGTWQQVQRHTTKIMQPRTAESAK